HLLHHHPSSVLLTAPPPTQTYPLSLHDALPILERPGHSRHHHERHHDLDEADQRHRDPELGEGEGRGEDGHHRAGPHVPRVRGRSEEHTSELQSLTNLVCRLLLEKKKKQHKYTT